MSRKRLQTRGAAVRLKGAWWRRAPLTPAVRRLLQVMALGVIAATPVLQLWGVGTARVWSPAELSLRYGPVAAEANGLLRRHLGDPPDWLPGAFVGGAWSYKLGPVELADPIALMTVGLGGALPAASLLLGAVLVLAFHVLFGRLFCAVLCPYGMVARLMLRLRKPLKGWGLVHDLKIPGQVRWVVLAAVLVAPILGGSIVTSVLPYLALSRVFHAALWGGLGASLAVVSAMALSDLLLWDTGVCRGFCPSGALQGLLGRFRLYRLQARADRTCDRGCHNCSNACWLGLDPRGGAPDPDCDGCGRCVKACPNNRLETMFRIPGGAPVQLPSGRHVAVVLAGVMAASSITAEAAAPARIDGSWSEASPFMPPADPERQAEVRFTEVDRSCPGPGGDEAACALSLGTARLSGDELALRIFLEEAPATPYTGPLRVRVDNAEGSLELAFEGPKHPRSVPHPTLYEDRLSLALPATLTFLDGPAAGSSWSLPQDQRDLPWILAPSASVLGAWVLLFLPRMGRKDHAPSGSV